MPFDDYKKLTTLEFYDLIFKCGALRDHEVASMTDDEIIEKCGSMAEIFKNIDPSLYESVNSSLQEIKEHKDDPENIKLSETQYFKRNLFINPNEFDDITHAMHSLCHLVHSRLYRLLVTHPSLVQSFLISAIINAFIAGVVVSQKDLLFLETDKENLS